MSGKKKINSNCEYLAPLHLICHFCRNDLVKLQKYQQVWKKKQNLKYGIMASAFKYKVQEWSIK